MFLVFQLKPMFVERQVSSWALFTLLVRWHASDVSLPPGAIILAELACPLNDVILRFTLGITSLSLFKHWLVPRHSEEWLLIVIWLNVILLIIILKMSFCGLSFWKMSFCWMPLCRISFCWSHSAECRSAECHSAKCASAKCYSAESHSAQCHSTQCHSTQCHSA